MNGYGATTTATEKIDRQTVNRKEIRRRNNNNDDINDEDDGNEKKK